MLGALLILAAVAALYFPTLHFNYVWDDRTFFVTAADLREGDIWTAITAPVLSGTSYFRPLVMGMFVAELRLFSADPFVSHLVNLLIHLASTSLVGWIALASMPCEERPTRERHLRALCAMAVFGLHPSLIEPVAWISGRFDLAVTFFSLLALAFVLGKPPRVAWLAAPCFLAAALCKEMAATLPLLAFLLLWARKAPGQSFKEALRRALGPGERLTWLLLFAAGLIYLALRHHFVSGANSSDEAMYVLLDAPWKHAALVGQSILFYLQHLLWPFLDIGPLHPFDIREMDATQISLALLAACGYAAFILFALVRPSRPALMLSAALLALLPVINIIPLRIIGNIGHERFLALPVALTALALAVNLSFRRWPLSSALRARIPAISGIGVILWCVIAALNLQVTVPLWRSDYTLWKWAYSAHPEVAIAQFSLISAALFEKDYATARQVIEAVEKSGPVPARLQVPYGHYLLRTGHPQEAIRRVELALQQEQQPHLDVLKAGVALEDAKIAKQDFQVWLLVYAFNTLSEAHATLRQFDAALQDAEIVLFYQRDNPAGNLLKAFALYGLDRWDDAEAQYQVARGLQLAPARLQADALRLSTLSQLCSVTQAPRDVCRRFRQTVPEAPAATPKSGG